MALKRKQHWKTRAFHQFLVEHSSKEFAWGSNDCCLFAANAIEAITGTDIAAEFRGKYTGQLGALRAISKVSGGSTVADAATWCADKHGLTEHKHPLMAKRGDLVLIDNGGTLIAGVVHLNGRHVVSMGEKGAVRLPVTSIVRAWSLEPTPVPLKVLPKAPAAIDMSLPALPAAKAVPQLESGNVKGN